MCNQADNKFTWVIKDFSFSALEFEEVYSDMFVVGRCKWRLLAISNDSNYYISVYMVVHDHESLPCGWRRHAKFSFTVVNRFQQSLSTVQGQSWFDRKNHTRGFQDVFNLFKLNFCELVIQGEVKIVAEVDVLEVIGKLDVSVETIETVDINGFQVLASQVESVKILFEKHPNIALKFRPMNPHLRTTYLNVLLSLNEILCRSPEELSNDDLVEAYSALKYVTEAGFKLDWLAKKLKDAGETRIPEIQDMDALLEFLK